MRIPIHTFYTCINTTNNGFYSNSTEIQWTSIRSIDRMNECLYEWINSIEFISMRYWEIFMIRQKYWKKVQNTHTPRCEAKQKHYHQYPLFDEKVCTLCANQINCGHLCEEYNALYLCLRSIEWTQISSSSPFHSILFQCFMCFHTPRNDKR